MEALQNALVLLGITLVILTIIAVIASSVASRKNRKALLRDLWRKWIIG